MVSREPAFGQEVVRALTNYSVVSTYFYARPQVLRSEVVHFNMAEKAPGGPRRPSAFLRKFKKAAETVKQLSQRFIILKRKSHQ